MAPRKKPIDQLAESTRKRNPSRVAKRTKQPLIVNGLTVPPHFDADLKQVWAELIESYPGLNASHKHLVEIAANALLRSRRPNAKSSELAFLHRITNQLQQAVIDYVPSGTSSPSPAQDGMTWALYEVRNKERVEKLNAGNLSVDDFTRLEEEDAEQLDDEGADWARYLADNDRFDHRQNLIRTEMQRRKEAGMTGTVTWFATVRNELFPKQD